MLAMSWWTSAQQLRCQRQLRLEAVSEMAGGPCMLAQAKLGRLVLRFAWFKSISTSVDTRDKIMPNYSSAACQRKKIASMNLVSATVFLLPDKLALIQQLCAQKNRRISDLISEAVDDYLCKSS
jgi:hypothetical protein